MENLYPLLNTDRKAQLGCFAALPSTGPKGAVCSGCAALLPDGAKFICGKWKALMGRKGKPISPNSSACRYFDKRPAFNTTKDG